MVSDLGRPSDCGSLGLSDTIPPPTVTPPGAGGDVVEGVVEGGSVVRTGGAQSMVRVLGGVLSLIRSLVHMPCAHMPCTPISLHTPGILVNTCTAGCCCQGGLYTSCPPRAT